MHTVAYVSLASLRRLTQLIKCTIRCVVDVFPPEHTGFVFLGNPNTVVCGWILLPIATFQNSVVDDGVLLPPAKYYCPLYQNYPVVKSNETPLQIDAGVVGGNWVEFPAGSYQLGITGTRGAGPATYCQIEASAAASAVISHAPEGNGSFCTLSG